MNNKIKGISDNIVSESGDESISYIYYFDSSLRTIAILSKIGFFTDENQAIRCKIERIYNPNFQIVTKNIEYFDENDVKINANEEIKNKTSEYDSAESWRNYPQTPLFSVNPTKIINKDTKNQKIR